MAVVDPECRVIGVDGLRVADSSIFPRVTNGNLNAPSIMVGEKAADHMLGRTPLAPSNLEPWINPRWRLGAAVGPGNRCRIMAAATVGGRAPVVRTPCVDRAEHPKRLSSAITAETSHRQGGCLTG